MDRILQNILIAIGMIGGEGREDRADAEMYTVNFSRALEHERTATYDIRYPEMKGRRFVPVPPDQADTADEKIVYEQWDMFGMAMIIANYADDLPMVDALAAKFDSPIVSLGDGYLYSIQDVRRAAKTGRAVNTKKAAAARRFYELAIDKIIAIGESRVGLYGVANNPNVPIYAFITGNWTDATSGLLIAKDMAHLVKSVIIASKEIFTPTLLLMPLSQYQRAATTFVSTTGDTAVTALAFFKTLYPGVAVESWDRLSTAGVGGTTRMVCYPRTPDVLTFEEPQSFEMFPPQPKNLAYVVPAHGRTGGVIVYYPIAMGYMDGI